MRRRAAWRERGEGAEGTARVMPEPCMQGTLGSTADLGGKAAALERTQASTQAPSPCADGTFSAAWSWATERSRGLNGLKRGGQ